MSSWAQQRRLTYITIFIFVIVGILGFILFKFFYKPPTCFDGIRNGREQGIDCGGNCVRLCQSNFIAPAVAWASFDKVSEGIYNLAAYIINPNPDVAAIGVSYKISLFDRNGSILLETNNVVNIPTHRNTLAFIPNISTGKSIPYKAIFEFTRPPEWKKYPDLLLPIKIQDKKYNEDTNSSSLLVNLYNDSVYPAPRMNVYVVLRDEMDNIIGFSKTVVDSIPPKGMVEAPFTWSYSRNGKVVSIEVLPVAE